MAETMYDELVKRLRAQAVYLPEKFSKNAELLDVLMKAADAIEELICEVADEHNARLDVESRQRWIPVTERLPEQGATLSICFVVGGAHDQLSWYELCDFAEGQFWLQDYICEGRVTHWMPLPEPPKEG